MDHMLHSLKSSRHKAEDLGMSNSVASLDFLDRRISCGEQLNRDHQENSMAMSMPYAHQLTNSMADSGASGAVKCQELHFKRLEQGLQESSLCELDCPGPDSKAPNIMLQPAKQSTNCRERALDRVMQACTVKTSMQHPRCRRKSVHLPNLSSQLGQSASVQFAGREDGMLSLAPIDTSPRRATFAHTDKTASAVISALYDRVRPANSATSGRNLRFRWNRQLVIIQGTKAGALSACCLL